MSDVFEYAAPRSPASLSILSFLGLGALSAFLWQVSPSSVILLLIPALAVCLWQVARPDVFALRLTASRLQVFGAGRELIRELDDVEFLGVVRERNKTHMSLFLKDGTEIGLPASASAKSAALLTAIEARGIPVRRQG